jgi:hypothetical protein
MWTFSPSGIVLTLRVLVSSDDFCRPAGQVEQQCGAWLERRRRALGFTYRDDGHGGMPAP